MTAFNSKQQIVHWQQNSLRSKLNRKFKSTENFSRYQTKIIILSQEGVLEEARSSEAPSIEINFEDELACWKSKHLGLKKDDLILNEFLDKTLELILQFLVTSERKPENSVEYLKYAMNESGANVILLDLPRESRKMIFKRLDSLLFKKSPFHQILKDPTVKKIVIENSIRIFYQSKNEIKIKKQSLFTSRLEAKVFNLINSKMHFQNSETPSEILNLNEQNLLFEKSIEEDSKYFIARPINQKATTLLDLMRDKTLATAEGPFIIKYLNNAEQGILISGATSSGKTKVIASFLSTITNSKFVALTGNPDEFKNISKDFQLINRDTLLEAQKNSRLEYLADSVATSGITYYVADNSSPLELSFAYLLHLKHGIPALISITAKSDLNTLLHYVNEAMNLLKYTNEKEYFIWNLLRAFPMLFSISNGEKVGEGTLYKINNKNNIVKLTPISIGNPENISRPNI